MNSAGRPPKRASCFSRLRPNSLVLVVVWLLVMILILVADWSFDQAGFVALTNAMVIAQAALVFFLLSQTWSKQRLASVIAPLLALTWLAEFAGHTSGLIFGRYHYTDLLQPQLGGVPLLIPLGWLMMLPPAWAVASRLVCPSRRIAFAMLSGLAFSAWDLYLDPQMAAKLLWVWEQPGLYFGIPLLNFAGWWWVSSLITFTVNPHDLPVRPLALIYTLTGLFQLVGLGVFWGQPLPALAGFIAMGVFSLLFWRKERWN